MENKKGEKSKGGEKVVEDVKKQFDKFTDKAKEFGDRVKQDIKSDNGLFVKAGELSLSIFPDETKEAILDAQKSWLKAQEEMIESGKEFVILFSEAVENLRKKSLK